MDASQIAFCSIISKNHVSHMRVLAKSIRAFHPSSHVFVLIIDSHQDYIRPSDEPFTIVEMEAVFGRQSPRFRFQYTAFELACSAKPYLLDFLFKRYGLRKIAYFDSDVLEAVRKAGLL